MIIQANALHIPLKDNSVQCVVTSPPYYGLRMYATAKWVGGNSDCDHVVGNQVQDNKAKGAIVSGVRPGCDSSMCQKCGAERVDAQIGLEPTVEEYIDKMVRVFREVRRVLRPDGVCFLNLGDSYGTGTIASRVPGNRGVGDNTQAAQDAVGRRGGMAKQLLGIPWRVAFALQSDGWYLRQDIIWNKTNPMPESVQDRCTKAHEYIFLLTKSARYFWDAEAVKEPNSENSGKWGRMVPTKTAKAQGKHGATSALAGNMSKTQCVEKYYTNGRNRRSVWTISSQPYKGAHFATYPEKLVEPCILAGSKFGDIVFDPFSGSGTTGVVAEKYGRSYVGLELSWDYIGLSKKRMAHNQIKLIV